MRICDKEVELFASKRPGAPLIVVNGEDGEGKALRGAAATVAGADFSLAAIGGICWEDELTPWPALSAFSKQPPYAGGADGYLKQLTESILPQIIGQLGAPPAYIALAGYSLAGLFALYAMYRTDAFARFASASGSLWYPGFVEYVLNHEMPRRPERVYLSVGDREARTRNAVMRPVEENTRRLYGDLRDRGIDAAFELNSGGHFDDPLGRLARAVAWTLTDGRDSIDHTENGEAT